MNFQIKKTFNRKVGKVTKIAGIPIFRKVSFEHLSDAEQWCCEAYDFFGPRLEAYEKPADFEKILTITAILIAFSDFDLPFYFKNTTWGEWYADLKETDFSIVMEDESVLNEICNYVDQAQLKLLLR